MFDLGKLPGKIADRIAGLKYSCDDIGESGSTLLLFDDMVLKIERASRSSKNERLLLEWLAGKLPVPELIETDTQDNYSFLLMSRLSGEMACSEHNLHNIEDTVKALAKGLKMLWDVDISGCPVTNTLDDKIVQARFNIDSNLVDMDDFNPETFTTEGFRDVDDLYGYLKANPPKEDLVFSHGDYCLPNVFITGSDVRGFIDLGSGGIADRWQDIALCVRSLQFNYAEYADYEYSKYLKHKAMLFDELGVEPDEDKIRYYILLDELF